jgi:hypothetical protein
MVYPGLTSWAIFSRPSGTEFGNGVLTHALKAARMTTFVPGIKSPAYFKAEFFGSLFSAVTELRDLVTPTWPPPARKFFALKFDAELDMRLL